jgi:redox-sensing transcriptional repressor
MFLSEQGGQPGQPTISSGELADYLGVNPWLIRKDFSYFGNFGTPGVGYNIKKLIKQISKILKLDVGYNAALVGVGKLGSAVLGYLGFKTYGFNIVAAFDSDPKKIGRKANNITIEDISKIQSLKKRNISLGVIAVPHNAAQQTAEALIRAEIRGILNFSPCCITVPKKVKVISIDIAMDLVRLPYYMPAG